MTQASSQRRPEFSRPIIADKIASSGIEETIEADEAERRALAGRMELIAIDRLRASVRLRRIRGEMIRVVGRLEADVVQTCVVTLDPVSNHVSEEFSALYAPDHLIPREDPDAEALFSLDDDEDFPEPMPGGRIDIGELVAQHLSLGLDPYPRVPGVSFQGPEEEEEPVEEPPARPNPFEALARLKRPI